MGQAVFVSFNGPQKNKTKKNKTDMLMEHRMKPRSLDNGYAGYRKQKPKGPSNL